MTEANQPERPADHALFWAKFFNLLPQDATPDAINKSIRQQIEFRRNQILLGE